MDASNEPSLTVRLANADIAILEPTAVSKRFGIKEVPRAEGLIGCAVVFRVEDLCATVDVLTVNAVTFARVGERIVVPPAPGQGVLIAFGR